MNGQLIRGSSEVMVQDVTSYVENIKVPNTLLFLLRKWRIDWNKISSCQPCIIVIDRLYDEFEAIDNCHIILVENDSIAYDQFIEYYRSKLNTKIVGVTGTSGKSTTVGMIEHVLRKLNHKVVATQNSANGRTSHLKYLMRMDEDTEFAIMEMAVGKPGDILTAGKYFKPNIGVLTNIGVHHLDKCKDEEAYINTKAELLDIIKHQGTLIMNKDDMRIKQLAIKQFSGKVGTFAIVENADFTASNVTFKEEGMAFTLRNNDLIYQVYVPGFGEHQVYNALATIATLHELNIKIEDAISHLSSYKKLPLRLQKQVGINDCIVLNDTWNITTTSFISALKTLDYLSRNKNTVVLLGEIHKTGEHTEAILDQYVTILETYGKCIDTLITIGETGGKLIESAKKQGHIRSTYHFMNPPDSYELLTKILDQNSILLLKITFEDCPKFINQILK